MDTQERDNLTDLVGNPSDGDDSPSGSGSDNGGSQPAPEPGDGQVVGPNGEVIDLGF